MANKDEKKRFWFAQVPNPRTKEPHWVRVSSSGRLNNSTYAVFKVRQAKEWREVEAASLSDARTALLAGRGKRLNEASVAAEKAAKAKVAKSKPAAAKKVASKPAAAKKVTPAKRAEPTGGKPPVAAVTETEPVGA